MKARGTALGHLGPKQQCIPCPPCHPETLRHVTYTLRVLINMPTRVRASLPPTFYASIGNPFRLVAVCPHSALSLRAPGVVVVSPGFGLTGTPNFPFCYAVSLSIGPSLSELSLPLLESPSLIRHFSQSLAPFGSESDLRMSQ